jgi:hypothetical protein
LDEQCAEENQISRNSACQADYQVKIWRLRILPRKLRRCANDGTCLLALRIDHRLWLLLALRLFSLSRAL